MAATIGEGIPRQFARGDTVKWYENRRDYLPGDGWTLTVALVQTDDQRKITATDNGDGRHLVTIAPADSVGFHPGLYRYQVKVTNGTDVHLLEHGTVDVLQSFEDVSSGWDARSHAEKVLDAIRAVIEGKASQDQQNVSVGGQSLSRYNWPDLLELEREYSWRVRREHDQARIDAGEPATTHRQVRFTR